MAIKNLIAEAKKLIPTNYPTAHAWLDDLISTHQNVPNPVAAIRFFMLGLHACEVITLNNWDAFDSLVADKKSQLKLIH